MGRMSVEEHLLVRSPAPDWFQKAIAAKAESRYVDVRDCTIHYLLWQPEDDVVDPGGILLLHGGGAHAHWWGHIAPFFRNGYRVAAMDLSGMGDSGDRPENNSTFRAEEAYAVVRDAGLGDRIYLVGHSFGGVMAMRFASLFSEMLAGLVIADSPLYPPGESDDARSRANPTGEARIYSSFEEAVARFRLRPPQPHTPDYIVEYIARHSVREVDGGFTWKFDNQAMHGRRFAEPFHEHLSIANCRSAFFWAENSSLVTDEMARYTMSLMGPEAPIVVIPDAHHHMILDQPLAFVAALRTLLAMWEKDGEH